MARGPHLPESQDGDVRPASTALDDGAQARAVESSAVDGWRGYGGFGFDGADVEAAEMNNAIFVV
jgi:hypothetical protein